ncbi:srg-40 [Pristionchus pacificus]|uniref:Serpentine receptor class gamma n=1 Tax=Pristionchus pacificus TaxID=54126 RepID=A0A2A6BR88_PRIPA|nr:srg-40 [Pristionchus pacificus]|eukprot:PDM68346.1 srg-40 [Pristionchus pacificus]
MRVITIIYTAYGSISLILYLIVFIIINRLGTILSGPFSKLILLHSIVNIISYLTSWYSHRMRVEPLFWPVYESLNNYDFLRNFLTFLMPLTNYNQSVSNFLLTVNRFTAILWYNASWPVMIISIVVGSSCACSRLPMFTVWNYSTEDKYYFIQHKINLGAFWYQIGFCSILLIICTVLNGFSIMKLRKLGESKEIRETERSFFFVALCTFVAECANLFMLTGKQISQSYGYMNLWLAFNVGSPYVTDVCSLGLPYYLLLVKGPIRQRLREIICATKDRPVVTVLSGRPKLPSNETG